MTYPKKLKTIVVHTLDGQTFNVADTAEDNKASRALNEFGDYGTMHILDTPKNYIPFHAVQYIEVTEADGEINKADPYFCEEETPEPDPEP